VEQRLLAYFAHRLKSDPTGKMARGLVTEFTFVLTGPMDRYILLDIFTLSRKLAGLFAHIREHGPTLVAMILWARLLRSFAGGLHGLWAAFFFLAILVTKVLKQVLDSPVWIEPSGS
jgi:hypothetical protein